MSGDITANHNKHNPTLHHTLFHTYRLILKPIKSMAGSIPRHITGDHLTLVSFIWSGTAIMAGYLARRHRAWLLLIPLVIVCHIVTDTLDGEVGRVRGLPGTKWGYFMDHFLDFTFMSSIFLGFTLYIPSRFHIWFFILYVLGAIIMVTSFLSIDEEGLDLTACVDIGPQTSDSRLRKLVCVSSTEGLILLMILTFYLYATEGKPTKTVLGVIAILAVLIAVANLYRKQKHIRTVDAKKGKSA